MRERDPYAAIREAQPGSEERVDAFRELPDGEYEFDGKKVTKDGSLFEIGDDLFSSAKVESMFRGLKDIVKIESMDEDGSQGVELGRYEVGERREEVTQSGSEAETREVGSGRIEDFGEKIGGARKDLAEKTGPRTTTQKKEDSGEPKWKRDYLIDQLPKGKWAVFRRRAGLMLMAARNMFDTREEAERALPAVYVADKFRFYTNKDGKVGLYKFVPSSRNAVPLKGGFESREAAMRWALQHVDELDKIRATYGERDLALKPDYERTGERRLNHDATAKDFSDAFGFRGVEFGNWENQRKRQQLMNDAYEALHDLAELLNIPARGISLEGKLGLAFGSRGHGGSARAHYEPNYVVINLTKPSGAGSFAHEWFHALDNYFRKQALKSSDPVAEYISDKTRQPEGSGMRQELFEKFEALKKSILENDRPPTAAEQAGYRENIEYRKNNLKTAIAELRQRLQSGKRIPETEDQTGHRRAAQKV